MIKVRGLAGQKFVKEGKEYVIADSDAHYLVAKGAVEIIEEIPAVADTPSAVVGTIPISKELQEISDKIDSGEITELDQEIADALVEAGLAEPGPKEPLEAAAPEASEPTDEAYQEKKMGRPRKYKNG